MDEHEARAEEVGIYAECPEGTPLARKCELAVALADVRGLDVVMLHNGEALLARPGDVPSELIERWRRGR